MNLVHPSIVDLPEAELVRRVMVDARWRSFVGLPEDFAGSAEVGLRVPLPFLGAPYGRQGDIDVLALGKGGAEEALAVEVKRVKAVFTSWSDFTVNKIADLERGAKQANRLAALGFSRVFLQVLVLSDTRRATAGQWSFAGVPADVTVAVTQKLETLRLESHVGIVCGYFDQPVDKPPLAAGSIGIDLLRPAKHRIQPQRLTERIKALDFADFAPKAGPGEQVAASFVVSIPSPGPVG